MGLLVAGCVILALGWLAMIVVGIFFPSHRGTEFSPYSFNKREFETRSWLGRTVVQPSTLACPREISKHLTNAARTSGIDRWDLIEHSNGVWGSEQFEASILSSYFKMLNHDRDFFWEKWSSEHPELAKILWPSVQQLAIYQAYFAIPELMQLAERCPSTSELRREIASISLQAGLDQGQRHLAKRELDEARMAIEWAKNFGSSPALELLESNVRAELAKLSQSAP
jgi:hypothetical protein